MKKYKNNIFSLISYLLIPIVYILEFLYFTTEKVAALNKTAYDNYLLFFACPIIFLALLGIFFAFRGRRTNEPAWANTIMICIGIILSLLTIFVTAAGSAING